MNNEKEYVLQKSKEEIKNLSNEMEKITYSKNTMDSLLGVNLEITLNAIQEANIYMLKIKRKDKVSAIDELISPLEDAVKIYVNFKKIFTKLTIEQIDFLKKAITSKKGTSSIKNIVKKYAPSLLNKITDDEFIDAFDTLSDFIEVIYNTKSNSNKNGTNSLIFKTYSVSR